MTREDCRKILGEEATEEQITNMLNNYHIQESNKVKELEKQIATLNEQNSKYGDYDDIKRQLDEINQANMTEQEKLAKAREEIAKEKEMSDKILAESKIIKNTAKAKDILAGLNVSDGIIAKLVSEDETTTLNSVNELKTMLESQKELVAKETKESLTNLNLDPTLPNVKQGDDGIVDTFEKFSKLSATEQEKWINEHPNELENLS